MIMTILLLPILGLINDKLLYNDVLIYKNKTAWTYRTQND